MSAVAIQRPSLGLLCIRSDGVVAWQTCRHHKRSRLVHDIEVSGSHVGMSWNRDVLAVVADRLGQQPGPWRRYVRAH